MLYSARAECPQDIASFATLLTRYDGSFGISRVDYLNGGKELPDRKIEFISALDIERLQTILAGPEASDLHVVAETIGAGPLEENTLERMPKQ